MEQVVIEGGTDGGIYIYDSEGYEIVSWVADEFAEDPTTALVALNCLKMFYEQGEQTVKDRIGWRAPVQPYTLDELRKHDLFSDDKEPS